MSRFKIVSADEVIEMLKGRKYDIAQMHHTYIPDHGDFTGSNHIALQESMHRYHTIFRGWDDIGQHLTLMPDGKFVTGRSFNSNPAGIRGYNTDAFMIEIIGNFDISHDKLEGAQLESALKVYKYLITYCGAEIKFHNEHAAKSCPGSGIVKDKFIRDVMNFVPMAGEGKWNLHPTQEKVKAKVISFVLGIGDSGDQVKELQQKLIKQGYNLPQYGADGQYGRETKAAVIQFQKDRGLVVDGLAGPQTFKALETSSSLPKGIIKRGDRGENVRVYQKHLNKLNFKLGKEDGIFGARTEDAVKRFQSVYLPYEVDGVIGPNTKQAILKQL